MSSAFDAALAFTLGVGVPGYGEEGGEVDNPADSGGFTWRGITLSTYRDWIRDPGFTSTQLLQLSEDQIVAFYGGAFFNAISGNALPAAISLGTFDFAVNAGVYRAAVTLQHAAGATQDGSIGPETLAAVAAMNQTFLIGQYTALRHAFYASLSDYPTFGEGWDARTYACETAMTALLTSTPAQAAAHFHAVLLAIPRRGLGARRAIPKGP